VASFFGSVSCRCQQLRKDLRDRIPPFKPNQARLYVSGVCIGIHRRYPAFLDIPAGSCSGGLLCVFSPETGTLAETSLRCLGWPKSSPETGRRIC
jgi:hypothetical protein